MKTDVGYSAVFGVDFLEVILVCVVQEGVLCRENGLFGVGGSRREGILGDELNVVLYEVPASRESRAQG